MLILSIESNHREAGNRPLSLGTDRSHACPGTIQAITEIAEAEGFDLGRASRIARLAQLGPSIVEACATGVAAGVTLESVSRRAIPQRWDEQREQLRLA